MIKVSAYVSEELWTVRAQALVCEGRKHADVIRTALRIGIEHLEKHPDEEQQTTEEEAS